MSSSTFTPTPAELALVQKIFAHSDAQKLGALTGEVAVRIFGGSNLPGATLGEIWGLADAENNGWLSKKGAAIAVRLMGWAQNGESPREELINKPGPIPHIEGVSPPHIVPQSTGSSTAPTSAPVPGLPPLTPQDKAKFMKLFVGSGPVNGLLNGDKARDIFVKSKLPVEKLSQIWSLADTQNRGALDSTDFTVAMYLIQACMSGKLSLIPSTLPPGLYEQAGGKPQAGVVASHSTGSSVGPLSPRMSAFSPSNVSAIRPQVTGQSAGITPQMTGSGVRPGPALPSRPSAAAAIGGSVFGLQPQATGQAPPPQWDVTPAEKANSDKLFDELDSQRRGYIEGDVAVPFMIMSNLPEDVLALIWDLADINNDGRLTRDGFAVAMHLIQNKLAGKEIPSSLPLSLIPPSMRGAAGPFANPPRSPPPPHPVEPLRDLIWDEEPATPQPPIQPQRTGTLSPQHTAAAPATSMFGVSQQPAQDPFGSSPFGAAAPGKDLLGDDDDAAPTASPPLGDKSAEIGNAQNQLNSTNRSLESAKQERAPIERTLADQASQLSALQTQLSSAKAAYETESKLLNTLKERFANQSADIQRAREELIRAESDLSALRVEKAEIEGNLLRDKEEVRDLQRKMTETGTQAEALKMELEKVKKEAKQQKGLLAIAKKQLATREGDKAKVETELSEAQAELDETNKELAQSEGVAEGEPTPKAATNGVEIVATGPASDESLAQAAAQPLPVSPENGTPLTSPTAAKKNNPFDRFRSGSAASSISRAQSPFMPFGDAAIPTPTNVAAAAPVAPQEAATDPFGLDTFADEPVSGGAALVAEPTTTEGAAPSAPAETVSASTDAPATQTAESHFPPVESFGAEPTPAGPAPSGADETDLGSLKELEPEESDSEDEAPLAAVRDSLQDKGKEAPVPEAMPSFDDAFGDGAPTNKPASDAFGAPATPLEPPAGESVPPPTIETVLEPTPQASTSTAGVSDFDEALGKLPANANSTNGAAPQFSFDTAFDDNFDFATASEFKSSAPAAPAVAPAPPANAFDSVFGTQPSQPTNGHASPFAPLPAPQTSAPTSFDDAFGTTAAPQELPVPSNGVHISFDDAFGGQDSAKALAFDNAYGAGSSIHSTASQPPPSKSPFPPTSPPSSPLHGPSSPRVTARRSSSPPRSVSPPIRHSSPKLRPSTAGSHKESHEKGKDAPTRHSRLSIRLPFGKKKSKQDNAPPLPSQLSHLSPLGEPADVTPAVEDDVEAVKQLCGMGFSRSQAVAALEEHGYDVQRALNSLLGTQ